VAFLRNFRDFLPQDFRLKTVLVLRNQCDWLGSLAAEVGVSDTAFVDRLIRADDAFLHWDEIVRDLERIGSPGDHLTLLFENGFEQNARDILQFAGYSPAEMSGGQIEWAHANARRTEEGWVGERYSLIERSILALRTKTRFLEKPIYSHKAWRHFMRPLLGKEMRDRALKRLSAPRAYTVRLSSEQREAIKMHCEESNARLGAHLGLDLKSLGY